MSSLSLTYEALIATEERVKPPKKITEALQTPTFAMGLCPSNPHQAAGIDPSPLEAAVFSWQAEGTELAYGYAQLLRGLHQRASAANPQRSTLPLEHPSWRILAVLVLTLLRHFNVMEHGLAYLWHHTEESVLPSFPQAIFTTCIYYQSEFIRIRQGMSIEWEFSR